MERSNEILCHGADTQGWEGHVGACELKELCLATCSYLYQLLAADNSVSSEFRCWQGKRVILAAEKPGTADSTGREGGERSRGGFFSVEVQRVRS